MTTRPALGVVEARAPGTPVFRTGDIVAFRFRIVRYLAKGGMGELYEAEDLELHERIALKTILSHISNDERTIVRFKREVHLARQVTHPNVCRIYDVFRHRYTGARSDRPADEVVFLAMELLHGETLADKLRRDGPFVHGGDPACRPSDGRRPDGRAPGWGRAPGLQEPQRHAREADSWGRGDARRRHGFRPRVAERTA